MDNRQRARAILEEVLSLAFDRHVHVLGEAGYLQAREHARDYGYTNGQRLPALVLKHELMDEIIERLELVVADYLEHPREPFWPMHDERAIDELRADAPLRFVYGRPGLFERIRRWLGFEPRVRRE